MSKGTKYWNEMNFSFQLPFNGKLGGGYGCERNFGGGVKPVRTTWEQEGGGGQKTEIFANVIYEWPPMCKLLKDQKSCILQFNHVPFRVLKGN